jgi:hypothetical protein
VRSGLGLTIVRQIAQAHGGAVKLASEVGHGAAFAMWLPASPDTEPRGESARTASGEVRVATAGTDERDGLATSRTAAPPTS